MEGSMPRAIWTGSIAFGLVEIPVALHTATRDRSVRFHLVTPDGSCRLRRQLVCPETGRVYDFDDTARGVEIAPDQYVLLDQSELEALQPEAGREIEIEDFVDPNHIDPVWFETTYWIAPREGGTRGYRLLHDALRSTHRAGLARLVLRGKAHVAVIRAVDDALALSTVRWADEVEPHTSIVRDISAAPVEPRQLALAVDLIEALSRPFEPQRYVDTHRERLLALIDRKIAEGRVHTTGSAPRAAELPPEHEEEHHEEPVVFDLTDALRRSIERAGSERRAGS
jgi:DNA end-binding protein Ku